MYRALFHVSEVHNTGSLTLICALLPLTQVIVVKQSELDQSTAELRILKVQLDTTTAQKTEAEEQVKAEAKKSSDLNGLLGTFRDKLKTEREQGAASLSGMSDKLQTNLTMANDAHAAEVARTTKVIGDLDHKVTDLTSQLAAAEQKETVRASEVARLEGEVAAVQKVRRRLLTCCTYLHGVAWHCVPCQ